MDVALVLALRPSFGLGLGFERLKVLPLALCCVALLTSMHLIRPHIFVND